MSCSQLLHVPTRVHGGVVAQARSADCSGHQLDAGVPPVGDISLDNYAGVFDRVPASRFIVNSLVISFITVALGLFVNSLAGFSLSRLRWRGQQMAPDDNHRHPDRSVREDRRASAAGREPPSMDLTFGDGIAVETGLAKQLPGADPAVRRPTRSRFSCSPSSSRRSRGSSTRRPRSTARRGSTSTAR